MKKLISIATSLVMTMVVAASIFVPATAGPTPTSGVTFAIENYAAHTKDNTANGIEFPVGSGGKLEQDQTFSAAVYIYNAVGKDAISSLKFGIQTDIPENFININVYPGSSGAAQSPSITAGKAYVNKNDGKDFQSESNFGGVAFYGYYSNGVLDETDPAYLVSERAGVFVSASPNDNLEVLFTDPAKDNYTARIGGEKTLAAKEKYLVKFDVTLKAGLERKLYTLNFDRSLGDAFIAITSEQDNDPAASSPVSILDKVELLDMYIGVGESIPVPKTLEIRLDDSAVNVAAQRNITAAERAAGLVEFEIPVRIKGDVGINGFSATLKIDGPSASFPIDVFAVNGADTSIKGGLPKTVGMPNHYNLAMTLQEGKPEPLPPLLDDTVIATLYFQVEIEADTEKIELNIAFLDEKYPQDDPRISTVITKGDTGGDALEQDPFLSLSLVPANVYIGPAIIVTEPTTPTTPTAPATLPSSVTTTSSGGGVIGTPGDSGVAGVVSILVILSLAGSAVYFAKRKKQ